MRYLGILLCLFIFSSYRKVPYSISDNGIYPALCERAAFDPLLFTSFKQDPYYNLVMEYHTYEEGLEDLAYIRTHYPDLLEHFDKMKTSDTLGSPRLFDYEEIGSFSPSTLHYIKLAGDIRKQFGSLEGLKIIEIGAGHGGLCKVLSDLFAFESYTLVDLPGPLALAKKFLSAQDVPHVHFLQADALDNEKYDLVISNYGFSECDGKVQKRFLEKTFRHTKKGYLACDIYPKHFRVRPLGRAELIKQLRKSHPFFEVKNEEPQMGKNHFIITWK